MAFAKYGPDISISNDSRQRPNIRLDEIDKSQNNLVAEWIRHGGPASITGTGNIYSKEFAASISIQTQQLLQKIQFWGLSQKFIKILEMFQNSGD